MKPIETFLMCWAERKSTESWWNSSTQKCLCMNSASDFIWFPTWTVFVTSSLAFPNSFFWCLFRYAVLCCFIFWCVVLHLHGWCELPQTRRRWFYKQGPGLKRGLTNRLIQLSFLSLASHPHIRKRMSNLTRVGSISWKYTETGSTSVRPECGSVLYNTLKYKWARLLQGDTTGIPTETQSTLFVHSQCH